MTERAEQAVLDYLARVGQATYGHLSSRRRAAYLAELRSRIDDACADATGPQEVRRVLARFGDPADLVARECGAKPGGDEETGEESEAAAEEGPRHASREPPPWRGGPAKGMFRAGGTAVRAPVSGAPGRAVRGLLAAARVHPPETFATVLYLVSGFVGQIAFVWVVGAVLVGLSEVWTRRDKLVAVGVPPAATAVGMSLWPGEAPYIDQVILDSLVDTGVVGLRLAAVGCGIYLAVRITRAARSAES